MARASRRGGSVASRDGRGGCPPGAHGGPERGARRPCPGSRRRPRDGRSAPARLPLAVRNTRFRRGARRRGEGTAGKREVVPGWRGGGGAVGESTRDRCAGGKVVGGAAHAHAFDARGGRAPRPRPTERPRRESQGRPAPGVGAAGRARSVRYSHCCTRGSASHPPIGALYAPLYGGLGEPPHDRCAIRTALRGARRGPPRSGRRCRYVLRPPLAGRPPCWGSRSPSSWKPPGHAASGAAGAGGVAGFHLSVVQGRREPGRAAAGARGGWQRVRGPRVA